MICFIRKVGVLHLHPPVFPIPSSQNHGGVLEGQRKVTVMLFVPLTVNWNLDQHRTPALTMSDVNAHIIEPLKKFAKESMHLVKKCTKPDRKGE